VRKNTTYPSKKSQQLIFTSDYFIRWLTGLKGDLYFMSHRYPGGQRLFLNTPLVRATMYTLVIALVIWGIVLILYTTTLTGPLKEGFTFGPLIATVTSLCLLFYALILPLPAKLVSKQSMVHFFCALALTGLFCSLPLPLFPAVLGRAKISSTRDPYLLFFAVAFVLDFGWFIFVRIAIHVILFWNRLRRKYLHLALTHAHVMVAVLGLLSLILLIEVGIIFNFRSPGWLTSLEVVPTLFFLLGLGTIPIIVVVPPSALFSYIVMKRTTDRVRMLAVATSTLRQGDYTIRVPVVGEDEVAQLQENFNAMATDLQRAMRDLQSERDRVSALLQERRELIANVSHELRTPVATLRGYLETTLMHWNEMAPTTLHQDLQVMEGEVTQLQTRVEELFMLARAELGRLKLHREPTNVGAIIRQIVDGSAPLSWRSSKIEVVAEIPPNLPLVQADIQRLEQSLRNLLHNALRHTAPGGIIALAAETMGDMLAIHVKDTGEGIDTADLPHIWERFYQIEGTRHKSGGTGLGLALVKEWIEGMGGCVTVESVRGEGSCFTLHLPLAKQSLSSPRDSDKAPSC
jgi:signal transduction histidine kinase